MKIKNKILKLAKICHIIAKVLYIASFVVCLSFVALAIALPLSDLTVKLTSAEIAVLFGGLALYAFFCIGLLWNVEGIFKSVLQGQSPFGVAVSHYLKKIALFSLLLSIVPSLVASIVIKAIYPATELTFPIEFAGIVAGIVLFVISIFFDYGNELQKTDDETL